MSDTYSSVSLDDSLLLESWFLSNINTISANGDSANDYAYSTWSVPHVEDEAHVEDKAHVNDKAHDIGDELDNTNNVPPKPKEVIDTSTLQGIMIVYPKWQSVLTYLRLFIRVAILKGESENPHLITRASAARKQVFINALFAESLVWANTTVEELETGQKLIHAIHFAHTDDYFPVVSTKDGQIIDKCGILNMVSIFAPYF